jgi:hypothetical protein
MHVMTPDATPPMSESMLHRAFKDIEARFFINAPLRSQTRCPLIPSSTRVNPC